MSEVRRVTYSYQKNGEIHKVTRKAPDPIHGFKPGDESELLVRHNEYWPEGQDLFIKDLSPTSPNILMIEKYQGDPNYTFASCYELLAYETGDPDRVFDEEYGDDAYLQWP